MASHKNVSIQSAPEVLSKRGHVPDSWIKVAGILRGRKPNPLKELKTMRAQWKQRMKTFEKRSRA